MTRRGPEEDERRQAAAEPVRASPAEERAVSPTPPLPSPLLESWEVLDLLTALVQKSLVFYEEDEQGYGRYRLLEPMRQYARERLLEAGEAARVPGRHRDRFLALAEEASLELRGPDQREWFDRLEREHDNLRAALAWSETQGESEPGLQLGGALGWFWLVRGYWKEGREHLARLLALPGAEGRTPARLHALNQAGSLAFVDGDSEAAQALAEESLPISQELGDKDGTALSLNLLGDAAMCRGDVTAAVAFYEAGLAVYRVLGDKWGIALSLLDLGEATSQRGEGAGGQALWAECLSIFRELDDRWGIGWSLLVLGHSALLQGEPGVTQSNAAEALALFRESGENEGLLAALESLAAAALAQGRKERAARLLGAVEGLRAALHLPGPNYWRRRQDQIQEAVQAASLPQTFAAAWAEGQVMGLNEAVTFALAERA